MVDHGGRVPDAIGRRVAQALAARGWTQKLLAARAQVPPATISGVVTGRLQGADLKLGAALRICMVLGISLEWLAGRWIDDPNVPQPPDPHGWLLIGPGGVEHIAGAMLQQILDQLFAQAPLDERSIAMRQPEEQPALPAGADAPDAAHDLARLAAEEARVRAMTDEQYAAYMEEWDGSMGGV